MNSNQALEQKSLPKGLILFRQALRYLGMVEMVFALIGFCTTVGLNFIQIGLRWGFDKSIWWVQEVSLLMMMIAYFIGVSCVYRMRHDVLILFLVNKLPLKVQFLFYYLAEVLTIVFCSVVLVSGISDAPGLLTTYTVIMHLPEFYWTLPLLVASASMILTSVYYFAAMWASSKASQGREIDALEAEILINREVPER
jgi:C4-dicarboxylate transporter, DctQ subunit